MKQALPDNPGRRRLISAVTAEYHRLHKDLAPALARLGNDELANINVAQNVIRDCLTALFGEMTPFEHVSAIEMARRMASYALSTVPIEDQDEVVAAHLAGFADFHMMRTAQGAIITTEWQMHDGRRQTNFPKD